MGKGEKAGIVDIGVALPWRRLSARAAAEAWGSKGGRSERTVASYDEDSATLAVEAAMKCLDARGTEGVGALYFASVSAPYFEKSCAAIVAAALDLDGSVRTVDFGGSLRAGAEALGAAMDAVDAGRVAQVLVVAADCRPTAPGSPLETTFGDGGAAALVGHEGVAASPLASASVTHDILDFWRTAEQRSVRAGDPRFGRSEAYVKHVLAACRAAMRAAGVEARDVSRAVLPSPDGRGHPAAAKALGLEAGAVVDPMAEAFGVLGSAHPFVMLASALEASKPGERILFSAYGDGCSAMVLEVTEAVEDFRKRRRLSAPSTPVGYVRYLSFKRLLGESEDEGRPFSSPIQMSREETLSIRFRGKKCRACGTVNTLNLRVCPRCGQRDDFESVKLAKRGILHTYTQEHYFPSPDSPVTMAVIDLEGGARYLAQMTDAFPSEARIGMAVEMVFRRLHGGGGYHNYCWKCRPVRSNGDGRGREEHGATAGDAEGKEAKGAKPEVGGRRASGGGDRNGGGNGAGSVGKSGDEGRGGGAEGGGKEVGG